MDKKDLTIQELRTELLKKDEEIRKKEWEMARLKELVPVMPGETVYVVVQRRKPVVEPWRVQAIEIDEYGRSALKFGWYRDRYEQLSANRIGKTWFLTREEAEEAAGG